MTMSEQPKPTLLVLGGRTGSLGDAIALEALQHWDFKDVVKAGISDLEEYDCDVRQLGSIKACLNEVRPTYIVCTVGVNQPHPTRLGGMGLTMQDAFHTNVIGPMEVLHQFITSPTLHPDHHEGAFRRRFVAISSNSARIPRSGSAPYCASKAALSMALRVAARDLADDPWAPLVWGYEPGLLAGTPMTEATLKQFGNPNESVGAPVLHRMKGVGPLGLPVASLAERIVSDLCSNAQGLHGTMIPFDAGEL